MLRRWIRAWVLTALVALGVTGMASAHAILIRTDPIDGSVLAQAPKQVRLWFSEAVLPNFTSIKLIDGDGRERPVTRVQLDPGDPKVIVIDLPALTPNAYRLTWRTLSGDDLHYSSGALVFGVQQAAHLSSAPIVSTAPQPGEILLRWLNFLSLAGLVGCLAIALIVLPVVRRNRDTPIAAASGPAFQPYANLPDVVTEVRGPLQRVDPPPMQISNVDRILPLRSRLLRLALWCAVASLIASAALLVVQAGGESDAGDTGSAVWQILTQTGYGVYWLMRDGWLIALILIVFLHLRGQLLPDADGSRLLLVIAPLIMALALSHALTSHAAASDAALLPVIADGLHLLAASVWVGGLFALAVTIVPLLRRGPPERALARRVLRRFGGLATVSLAVLLVTGLYSAGQQVASLDALVFTSYGQSLILKLGLALSVAAIAVINSAMLHPRVADLLRRVLHRPPGWMLVPPQQLWRTVLLESIGAALILLFAAVLSASPPARSPEFDTPAAETGTIPTLSTNLSDLPVTLSIKPNRPGQNFVLAGVFDTRRPALAPIEAVDVQLLTPAGQKAATLRTTAMGGGHYQVATDRIDASGAWQIVLTIHRTGLPDVSHTIAWQVPPAVVSEPRRAVISNQPLAPWLNGLAIFLVLLFGAVLFGLSLKHFIPRAKIARGPAARHLPRPLRKESRT